MNKHTPGPWKTGFYELQEAEYDALSVWPGTVKDGEKGQPICLVSPENKITDVDEANANLIAAAPELLEALEEIVNIRNSSHGDGVVGKCTEMWKVAQQAITKAEVTETKKPHPIDCECEQCEGGE